MDPGQALNGETSKLLPQRKHPVHMPPVERHNTPVILFVTLTLRPRGSFLANPAVHRAFLGASADADAWNVGKYVIMPDHIHLFCSPALWPAVSVKRWSGYLKERITKRVKGGMEGNPLILPWKWQSDCWDTQMRTGEHYHNKWEYVRLNPVRKGLVMRAEEWPWLGEINSLRW